jgi:hypothetical protein
MKGREGSEQMENYLIDSRTTISHGGVILTQEVRAIRMPPLRPYEMQDFPATALDIEPEPDAFALPQEMMTADEAGFVALPVVMPPLRPDELPDSAVFTLIAEADPSLDEPSWGMGSQAPDIVIRKGKLLHPWDEEPADPKKKT